MSINRNNNECNPMDGPHTARRDGVGPRVRRTMQVLALVIATGFFSWLLDQVQFWDKTAEHSPPSPQGVDG